MKKIALYVVCFLFLVFTGCKKKRVDQERMCARIDIERIVEMFPKTSEDIETLTLETQNYMTQVLQDIDDIKPECRTYLNTVLLYEQAYLLFYTRMQIFTVLATLSDNMQLQLAANLAIQELQKFKNTYLCANRSLYKAFNEYAKHGKDAYLATKPVQNFLKHMAYKSEQEGTWLPYDQYQELSELREQIQQLEGLYYSNVLYDTRSLVIDSDGLSGVSKNIIDTLHKDEFSRYIVPIDEAIYFNIMECCSVESTRKMYFDMYGKIAYPQNESILKDIRQKRYDFARILNYPDFASYQIHSLMMKQVKKVEHFLWALAKELQPYVKRDYQKMLRHLPRGVSVDARGKIKPWNDAYVKSQYRKKMFNIDDVQISEYFPLNFVLSAMLQQFKSLFYISFELDHSENLWSSDVVCYRIRSLKNQAILGYLMFDLYQRPGKKINDAGHMTIIPTIRDDCSIACVGAAVVSAQFKRLQSNHPTLLEFSEVITLFHEIGHGLHSILGATRFTMFSGTQVVQDFVEVPSMMLEYWFEEPEVLKNISSHFKTGKPLSKNMIDQLIAAQKFGRAGRLLNQVYMSLLSLYIFSKSSEQNISKLKASLYNKLFEFVEYDPNFHIESSFTYWVQSYAAAYYAYPLSAVIGADLFKHIKQHGLFNHEIGTRYIEDILSPGGSAIPQNMIKRFLGRNFTMQAYISMLI